MIPWPWFASTIIIALVITGGAWLDAIRMRQIARRAVEQLRICLAERHGVPRSGDTRTGDDDG